MNEQAETELRKRVRLLAALAGVTASAAVILPQVLPARMAGPGVVPGIDMLGVFLTFSFATFVIGVATPIYAYARAEKIGARMPAAAFAPMALVLAAAIAMLVIGQIRRSTREVEFRPTQRQPPANTLPRE
ncbi:MAG: hypothetical protein H6509_01755 [Bryobacterales bacterium]|nr:hypothetical protein [Bryobacterales bacterium]